MKKGRKRFDWDGLFMWGGIISLAVLIVIVLMLWGGPEMLIAIVIGFIMASLK